MHQPTPTAPGPRQRRISPAAPSTCSWGTRGRRVQSLPCTACGGRCGCRSRGSSTAGWSSTPAVQKGAGVDVEAEIVVPQAVAVRLRTATRGQEPCVDAGGRVKAGTRHRASRVRRRALRPATVSSVSVPNHRTSGSPQMPAKRSLLGQQRDPARLAAGAAALTCCWRTHSISFSDVSLPSDSGPRSAERVQRADHKFFPGT
jgi:hypothetical protein